MLGKICVWTLVLIALSKYLNLKQLIVDMIQTIVCNCTKDADANGGDKPKGYF